MNTMVASIALVNPPLKPALTFTTVGQESSARLRIKLANHLQLRLDRLLDTDRSLHTRINFLETLDDRIKDFRRSFH